MSESPPRARDQVTAEQWIVDYLKARDLEWEGLTPAERFRITMQVPCQIRCFRVGVAIDVQPGEKCPECGKERPVLTRYERMLNGTTLSE